MEVKKPVSVVEISNNVSTVQRMAFNVSIHHFHHSKAVDSDGTRAISVDDICRLMNYKKQDFFYLDEQLEKLQSTTIKWMGAKTGDFQRVNFFAYTALIDGVFYYRYDPFLARHIKNSKTIFALLDMASMGLLKKKSSLPLYEFCARFRPNKGFENGTPWIPAEELKLLLVGDKSKYEKWYEFKRWALDPAISEVNEKTDITIEISFRKRGRVVKSIKFRVKEKSGKRTSVAGFSPDSKNLGGESSGFVEAEYVDDPLFSNPDDKSGAADLSPESLGDFFIGVNGRRGKK